MGRKDINKKEMKHYSQKDIRHWDTLEFECVNFHENNEKIGKVSTPQQNEDLHAVTCIACRWHHYTLHYHSKQPLCMKLCELCMLTL